MLELVSIVIPVCGKKYFKECIDSICNQTYQELEIIIVDSSDRPDEVKDILFQMNDKRIIYLYQEKNGVANALNFGISRASGQYIARMDADDIALPGRIAAQAEYMHDHPEIDAAAASYILIDGKGDFIKKEIKQYSSEEIKYELLFGNPICHPTMMFRRSIFAEGWKYQNVFAEDYDLWTRLAVGKKMSVIPEVLLKYRLHADNLSSVHVSRVNASDIDSAMRYAEVLLGIRVETDKRWLLSRDYHLSQISSDEVGECGEFIIRQYEFLRDLRKSSDSLEDNQRELVIKIILRRWKDIINISNIICPPKEIYHFPLADVDDGLFRNYMLKLIEDNAQWIDKKRDEQVRFFLYGFGERGHRTLNRYLSIRGEKMKRWELAGIVDRKRQCFSINGKTFRTYDKKELIGQEFDYILVSAYEFYDEVKTELLELHIPQDKIIRDNIIFFF